MNFGTKFSVRNKKSEHHYWILHIQISLGTRFHLKQTFLNFWTNFAQKGCFRSKTVEVDITVEFYIFKLVLVPSFSLNWQFWFFRPDLPKKDISSQKQKNRASPLSSENLNLGTKFQLKLTILNFWTKFAQKGYFRSKMEEVNMTTEFFIFKVVSVLNFSLNWQFWFFKPNLPKKGIFGHKQKKWTLPLNSTYSN